MIYSQQCPIFVRVNQHFVIWNVVKVDPEYALAPRFNFIPDSESNQNSLIWIYLTK